MGHCIDVISCIDAIDDIDDARSRGRLCDERLCDLVSPIHPSYGPCNFDSLVEQPDAAMRHSIEFIMHFVIMKSNSSKIPAARSALLPRHGAQT